MSAAWSLEHGYRTEKSAPSHAIKPQAGMMVIIPSFLCHWVNPVTDGDRRISIANNMKLIPKVRRAVPGQFSTGEAA